MIFDTDVLVWVLRGNRKAARLLESDATRLLSVVSYMELLQGARNRTEQRNIKALLSDFGFAMLPLTENVGHRAAIYVEQHALASGVRLGDALLAATAVEHGSVLCTANRKHYKAVEELDLKVFRP